LTIDLYLIQKLLRNLKQTARRVFELQNKRVVVAAVLIAIVVVAGFVAVQMQGWFGSLPILGPIEPDNSTNTTTSTINPTASPTANPTPNTPTPTTTPQPTSTVTPTAPPTPTINPTPTPTPKPTITPTPGPAYSRVCYLGYNAVTLDGKLTASNEWVDAGPLTVLANFTFRDKMLIETNVWEYILIETSDNTNDSSDYLEISVDCSANSGSLPQTDDFKIVIAGHTNATWYQGNGTAWVPAAVPSTLYFAWNTSLTTSLSSNVTHWIYEVAFDRQGLLIAVAPYMRVAAFDGNDAGFGLQSWPPTSSADNPNGWGYIDYYLPLIRLAINNQTQQ
jgi:hypothetical protein